MFVVLAVVAASFGGLVAAGYLGYKYGQKVESEYTAAFQAAHSSVSAKLDAVKAEVAKLESEPAAISSAVIARLKALL